MKKRTIILFFGIMAMIPVLLTTICLAADTSQPKKHYAIKAQDLKIALEIYEDQSGQNIAYASKLVEDKTSNPINKTCSPAQALQTILKGTGLKFKSTTNGTLVLIQDAAASKSNQYKSDIQTWDHNKHSNLKMPRMSMDDMVVTATKTLIKTQELPTAVNVVTDEEIKITSGADSYYNALRHVPGVSVTNSSGAAQGIIYIRGMMPSILHDGRDMNAFVCDGATMNSSTNMGMGAVERIEVVKGPQSAIHGTKAVSGVLNVIRKRGDKNNPFLELRGLYGAGNEKSGGISIGGGSGNVSYFLDFSTSDQNDYETPKGNMPFTKHEYKNIFARVDYAFSENHELSLDYSYNWTEMTSGGANSTYINGPSADYSYGNPEYEGSFLTYRGQLNDSFSLYATIGGGTNDYTLLYSPSSAKATIRDKENETVYKEDRLQGELRGTVTLFDERLKAVIGMQYKHIDMDGFGDKTIDGQEKTRSYTWDADEDYWAPYTQLEFKPNPYLLLVGGVRYDDFDSGGKKMSATSPNAGVSIFPFASTNYNWTTLWLSYSKAFNTPSAWQRFAPDRFGGNPSLDPEHAKGWEIGLKQRISTWANLESSIFKTDYKDLIRPKAVEGKDYQQNTNIGEAEYSGYELLVEIYPTNWLTLHFGFSDLDREDKSNGTKLIGQPNQIFHYGLTIHDFHGFSFSLWGKQNKDFTTYSKTFYPLIQHPSEGDIIWNTKLLYHYNITDKFYLEPFISVENLTDETYYSAYYLCSIMEERAVHLGVSLRMNF